MGDGAEQSIDDGIRMLALHDAGECDIDCPYCYEKSLKKSKPNLKKRR